MKRRPDMLSRAEAAAYLGCSQQYLARKTPHRGGPATVKVGRTPYYLQADLDAWLAAQRRPSLPQPAPFPLPEVRKSPCLPPPASDSPASPSTSAKAPRTGGSISATLVAASDAPLARSIAEKLRRRHGATAKTSSAPLVGLRGGKETTSPSSRAST